MHRQKINNRNPRVQSNKDISLGFENFAKLIRQECVQRQKINNRNPRVQSIKDISLVFEYFAKLIRRERVHRRVSNNMENAQHRTQNQDILSNTGSHALVFKYSPQSSFKP